MHVLEVDHPDVARRFRLTPEQSIAAMLSLAELESELGRIRFDMFKDILGLLQGKDQRVSCVWSACDPYTTDAVRAVDGLGESTNCARTNKEGVAWRKADQHGYERQLSLYHTPQEFNGCKGCRFFVMCKGECPGTGEGQDWRNRTDQCGTWKALFEHYERKLLDVGIAPVSRSPDLPVVERVMLDAWARGENLPIWRALEIAGTGRMGVVEARGASHIDSPARTVHVDWSADENPTGIRGVAEVRDAA